MGIGIPFSTFGGITGGSAGFGCGTSSPDNILSRFDSIPATACCKNEPQRDDCFPVAAMILPYRRWSSLTPSSLGLGFGAKNVIGNHSWLHKVRLRGHMRCRQQLRIVFEESHHRPPSTGGTVACRQPSRTGLQRRKIGGQNDCNVYYLPESSNRSTAQLDIIVLSYRIVALKVVVQYCVAEQYSRTAWHFGDQSQSLGQRKDVGSYENNIEYYLLLHVRIHLYFLHEKHIYQRLQLCQTYVF